MLSQHSLWGKYFHKVYRISHQINLMGANKRESSTFTSPAKRNIVEAIFFRIYRARGGKNIKINCFWFAASLRFIIIKIWCKIICFELSSFRAGYFVLTKAITGLRFFFGGTALHFVSLLEANLIECCFSCRHFYNRAEERCLFLI